MPITKLRPRFSFTQDRLEQLKAVVPEAFADGKINWEALKQALGGFLEDENPEAEHFGLFWPGKREARRLATLPSKGTLVPAAGEGIDEDNTRNIFIEGENLEVLKLLQKSYAGRIKMIYIDPPYNTGNDFVYKDDFKEPLDEYLRRTGQADENGKLLTTNTKAGGRFHSNWLNMMYPRLTLCRQLLREDGVIFLSIDDSEAHNLRLTLDEIYGEENFVAELVWEGVLKNDSKFVSISHDYVLCYAMNKELLKENDTIWRTRKKGIDAIYAQVEELKGKFHDNYEAISGALQAWYRQLKRNEPAWQHRHYSMVDKMGVFFPGDISWPGGGGPTYEVLHPMTRKPVKVPARGWVFSTSARMQQAVAEGRVEFGIDETKVPNLKRYLHETEGQVIPSVFYKDRRAAMKRLRNLLGGDIFDNPKDEEVLTQLTEAITKENDLILDFFAGSCTTAQAVLELNREDGGNRRFIMVQLPEPTPEDSPARKAGYESIAEIGKERIRRVITKIKEERNGKSSSKRETPEDLGFKVFKLARSNFKAWQDYDGENIQELETLFDQAETPLVKGWKEEDLLTEIMLQQGFPLDSKITPQSVFKQNKVRLIESEACEHRLFVCLDHKIKEDAIKHLELRTEDIFVCLDSALTNQAKMRLADVCRLNII